jgi:hypothetical protein
MTEADKFEKRRARISNDISTLETIVPQGEPYLRVMLRLLLDSKKAEARELLSLINRITDNLTKLELLLPDGRSDEEVMAHAMTGPARTLVREAAELFAAVKPLER